MPAQGRGGCGHGSSPGSVSEQVARSWISSNRRAVFVTLELSLKPIQAPQTTCLVSKESFFFSLPQRDCWRNSPLWEHACLRGAPRGGTPVAGVFLRLLNKSLLGAGTAGSRFRIPDTHSRPSGGGTGRGQPAELGQVALPGPGQSPASSVIRAALRTSLG